MEPGVLQAAAEFYTSALVLDERIEWLNNQCLEAAERQERASKARKQLAEDTKEAKRNAATASDVPTVLETYNKLLKAYQAEVDALTKRAKAAEAALGDLYRNLEEAPDPGPLLEYAITMEQTISKQKFENAKLQTELNEFEAEFSELKNQDITIRELQDRIAELEHDLEAKEKVEEMASEMVKVKMVEDEDLKRELEELRSSLERVEREATEQRKAADAARTELYEVKAQFEERDTSRQTEIDLLQEELASIKQVSQSENEILRLRKLGIEEEERERKRREEELSRLYAALDAARLEAQRAREAEAEAQRKREKEVEEVRVRGEERLQRERDRVLELEKALSQSALAPDDDAQQLSDEKAEEERAKLSQSLESIIAQLRVSLNEKEALVERYKAELLNLEERVNDQDDLIRKLQQESMISGNSVSLSFPQSPLAGDKLNGDSTATGNVLGIYQELKDRFRRRILELEQELGVLSGKEKRSRELLEKTRAENAALAERVRMLRSGQRPGDGVGGIGGLGGGALPGGRSPLQIMLRFISGNSTARTLLVCYVVALHILVLASLSSSTSADEGAKAIALRGRGE